MRLHIPTHIKMHIGNARITNNQNKIKKYSDILFENKNTLFLSTYIPKYFCLRMCIWEYIQLKTYAVNVF